MSLAEIPLVFGLMFATGQDVILAAAVGRLVVLGIHRRLPPIRLAFNLGAFLLWSAVAVLVFHAVTGAAQGVDPLVWVAAALATAAASVTTALLIAAAVSLSEGLLAPGQVLATVRTDLTVAAANTSIALCAARLATSDWKAAILMVVPVAATFVTFRAYTTERQRHDRLEFLYEAARTLSRGAETGPALEGLLAQALEAFRAEVAELVLFAPDGNGALRTTVRAHGEPAVLEVVEPQIAQELRALVERQGAGASALSEIADGVLVGYLESRELSDGLFTVLKGERRWIGAMMLGNPSGVHTFSREDLKMFETLGNNTSVALENDRLGRTVWRMAELQRELEHQASHDPLTDLANRALFGEQVSHALQSESGRVSVIFIDIDDFKGVNDSLGHTAGDELLVAISRRLRDCVRPVDIVARHGGDEFAILLETGTSEEEAIEVTDRIIRRLSERFAIAGQSISVQASAGIATGESGAASALELIRNADVAMYRAKQAGKHGYQLFDGALTPGRGKRSAARSRS
jgi:diguanylate cyclase (GGDEF)-like protein